MKRKIALCISGHYRHFDACKNSLLNWLEHNSNDYDFDIFFSCWNDYVGLKERLTNNDFAHSCEGFSKEVPFASTHLNTLVETLKPKNYILLNSSLYKDWFEEKGKKIISYCDHVAHRPVANVSQLFIKNKAIKLVPKHVKYDLYIMTRFDVYIKNNFIINFEEMGDINFIENESHDGLSDLFIISKDLEPLEKYTELDLGLVSREQGKYSPHRTIKYFFERKIEKNIKIHNFKVEIFGVRY